MARAPVAARGQGAFEAVAGLVGGRGRGHGGSNTGCAPVSDCVAGRVDATRRVPVAGAQPVARRRGPARRVPAAGAQPVAGRGGAARQVTGTGRAVGLGAAVPTRRVPGAGIARHYVLR